MILFQANIGVIVHVINQEEFFSHSLTRFLSYTWYLLEETPHKRQLLCQDKILGTFLEYIEQRKNKKQCLVYDLHCIL